MAGGGDLVYFSRPRGIRRVSRHGWACAPACPDLAQGRDAGAARPYVLICPTFADGEGRGAVPKQVIHFLNDPDRRAGLRGVIATGNRNFGATYALAGRVISDKCNVPVLYRFELAGTDLDISRVLAGLNKFWGTECLTMA